MTAGNKLQQLDNLIAGGYITAEGYMLKKNGGDHG
jgi:hypothetical protein